MIEFEKLKDCYALTIQFGIDSDFSYSKTQHGNEALHEFCKAMVENSNYCDDEKSAMKCELDLLKEFLAKEIDAYYKQER